MTRTNDFAFKIATPNGTGSASANSLLMQAIFRMGVPVTGKNVFPSNIQGLPTWYEIRVSRDGYTARIPRFDLVAAFNPASFAQDVAEVSPGGWLVHDTGRPLDEAARRHDITYLGVPLAELCNAAFRSARERILMKNIAYAGVLAALLGLDAEVVATLMREKYAAKKALLDSNEKALALGYDYARRHLDCPLPIHVERMDLTRDSVLIDGNTATALGALYAGATVGAWYPITPATGVMEAFKGFCETYRRDPATGQSRFAILQAEDEMAAIGMVLGATWAGARAFTPTSGPGLSLMNEFLGFAYYAEVPAVVVDVQRAGPSTGLPTRTQQGDLLTAVFASHGDTRHLCLFPADPKEAFEMTVQAFDLADRFQTPVFLLSDLDIGMNDWMVPALAWDDGYVPDRGKVLTAAELEQGKRFSRYVDVDGDAIPYRTLPGEHPRGAYFTRGSGHDKHAAYTEDPAAYQEVLDRLRRKIQSAAKAVPPSVVRRATGAAMGLVTVGSGDAACREALDRLAREGIALDYLRVRGYPFGDEVRAFLAAHEVNFIVEQNRDGQLQSLLALDTGLPAATFEPVRYYAGFPLSADRVVEGVKAKLEKAA